jgi:hypothetical protein
MQRPNTAALALGTLVSLTAATAAADFRVPGPSVRPVTYDVTVTNITHGTFFTPLLVVSHRSAPNLLFTPGAAPSDDLAHLAEAGDRGPFSDTLSGDSRVLDIEGSSGALPPGHSVTVSIQAVPGRDHISLGAMMVPTNDGFVALQDAPLPNDGGTASSWADGYDAGSETNDEVCNTIPGPCGADGQGYSPADPGEGYVHIHAGIKGVGTLDPALYDWNDPVALVTITRAH